MTSADKFARLNPIMFIVATFAGCKPLVVSFMGSDINQNLFVKLIIKLISSSWKAVIVKSANMLEKPVPSLDRVITKIMDVVWIEDVIEYEKVKRVPVQTTLIEESSQEKQREGIITKSKILIINYKRTPQKFNLYAIIPEDSVVGTVIPKPSKISNNYIKWNLETIQPANKIDISYELAGLSAGDFDENDLYVENINPTFVIGADKWEGD